MLILDKNKSLNCSQIIYELKQCGIAIRKVKPVAYEARKIPSNYTGEVYGWVAERCKNYWIARTGVSPLPTEMDRQIRDAHPNDALSRTAFGLEVHHYRFFSLDSLKTFVTIVECISRARRDFRISFLQLQNLDRVERFLKRARASAEPIDFYNGNGKVFFSIDEIECAYNKLLKWNTIG